MTNFKDLFETENLQEGKITDFFAGIKAKLNDRKLDKEAKKFYEKAGDELERAHDFDFDDPERFPFEDNFMKYMAKAREIEKKMTNKDK